MPDPAFLIGGICEGRRVPAVTIFGWDDVLCPTTHAKRQRERVQGRRRDVRTSKLERKELLQLGQSVVRLVKAARRHGPVVIVTKSQERWVRGTAELLLPGGAAAACLANVEIVSSSDRFGGDFPNQPACWQIAALSYVTNRYLLSDGALARVRLANAAAAVATGAQEAEWSASGDGGDIQERDPGDARARGEAGAYRKPQGGGTRRRVLRRGARPGTSGTDSSDDNSGGDCGASAIRLRGILIAVATAPRSWENKSAALTLREHHPDVVAKTVSLVETPTPLELSNQLDLLAEKFELLFGHCLLPQEPQSSSPAVAAAAVAAPAPAPAPAPPVRVEAASAPPAAPPAPAPAPAPAPSTSPPPEPALSEPVTPATSSATTPVPAATPVTPEAAVVPEVPTLELPPEVWRLEDEESRSLRVQPESPRGSAVGGGEGGGQKIDFRGDDDGVAGDDDDPTRDDGGRRGRRGSFWGSASPCASSPAFATVCAPLADAVHGDPTSTDTRVVPGVFGLAAIVVAAPGEGSPPKYQKSGKQHLSLWSSDGDDGDEDDDDDEYLTAVCSESTMSSNVSSLVGEVGVGGGMPFAVDGTELLSPPLGWAAAASAPPNPPPRLHRRRTKAKPVAVE